jgi:CheY-like chemotaxis protein
MSRILLADRSPHAQRMGERILREEGFEVVTVTSGESALVRLGDADADLALVDVSLPDISGYSICARLKGDASLPRIPVILTVGEFDPFDEQEARRVEADGVVKKPFEASVLSLTVRKLLGRERPKTQPEGASRPVRRQSPPVAIVDPERVRAAVTVAVDAAMPALVDEITRRVLVALSPKPVQSAETQSSIPNPLTPDSHA